MTGKVFLTSDLARAARAFTKVSAATIAEKAGLTREQVKEFESGRGHLSDDEKSRVRASLEFYGALFIPEDDVAGYGVRRRYAREKLMRLNNWESEGGYS
ncbi:XRE family transcriptional regulator [Brevibacterium luteolum]|uniref:XRE family transcriptional regulator n=1 Tax=Brevibacterium luteolum TaxID=199591 RepID=UPI003B681914